VSSILGGFLGTIYTNPTLNTGTATNRGIITRFNPVVDPGNLPVKGTGERGLYDILIGRREPRITIEFLPTDKDWLASIQDGSSGTEFLFLKFVGGKGLTFVDAYVNRFTLEGRDAEAIQCSAEFWAGGDATYPVGVMTWDPATGGILPTCLWGARQTTPYRWLDSDLRIGVATETQWWSWRYEVNNNLQRLGNVATGGTRAIKPKQRDVSGSIVKDLEDFEEYGAIADLAAEMARFNIRIRLDSTEMLNCDRCRWGTLEAPSGPEDLIAKRFPFTATDLTTLTP